MRNSECNLEKRRNSEINFYRNLDRNFYRNEVSKYIVEVTLASINGKSLRKVRNSCKKNSERNLLKKQYMRNTCRNAEGNVAELENWNVLKENWEKL